MLSFCQVRVVSPYRDFFQIISHSLRLLHLVPREWALFVMKDFAEQYLSLKPSQSVDMISLVGDKAANIPAVDGIGDVHALQLINRFGTLENLLQCVDQVAEERIKKDLITHADQAVLSKELAILRCDLPDYMFNEDLEFRRPADNGKKFTSLLNAISAYAKGLSADPVIRRASYLWKRLDSM
ncbi:unnamed protein product [Linum tenue]|uniref:5'-3' exonuclease domain-containing protein n=1 Tax=Linum tenue TaxID=586396 RepID=A0AAV0KE90_9ROSI|nr:unnamed protein product [Linum tenue]